MSQPRLVASEVALCWSSHRPRTRRDLFIRRAHFPSELFLRPGRKDLAMSSRAMTTPLALCVGLSSATSRLFSMPSTGALLTEPLISHRFSIEQAAAAYELPPTLSPPLASSCIPYTADYQQSTIACLLSPLLLVPAPAQPAAIRGDRAEYASRILIGSPNWSASNPRCVQRY